MAPSAVAAAGRRIIKLKTAKSLGLDIPAPRLVAFGIRSHGRWPSPVPRRANRTTVEAYGAAYAITVSPSAVKARHPASCDNHITLT
jgi:hypothetical protein